MSLSQSNALKMDFSLRPRCPKCGMKMWLVLIEPNSVGHDKRTFDCTNRRHSESVIVKYDEAAS